VHPAPFFGVTRELRDALRQALERPALLGEQGAIRTRVARQSSQLGPVAHERAERGGDEDEREGRADRHPAAKIEPERAGPVTAHDEQAVLFPTRHVAPC
jgi:hypothetical protein